MENTKLYKEISLKIIKLFENDELDKIENLLDERQRILNLEFKNEKFKKILVNEGIIEIDKTIHNLLNESIDEVKREIQEYNVSKQANNSYMNFNKEKINIFNKKV
ncbi:flagellar protein FliT [Romboutsia lituseburensis]|uniref:flagellar protein FliT n=1 Tax=Romboutsia lituseburensis TaxID=1537 RepID=UPI00215B752A|nr:flagellar protein FliT [Romboutsia lituseburensis]MCR8746694.1 flagellar protein FliT [Romboutsia lituseburensis]